MASTVKHSETPILPSADEKLSIVSYNCNGFKTSITELNNLCSISDVICLQELWLDKSELNMLSNLNSKFIGFGISPVDIDKEVVYGRKYGGVGFLWKSELENVNV